MGSDARLRELRFALNSKLKPIATHHRLQRALCHCHISTVPVDKSVDDNGKVMRRYRNNGSAFKTGKRWLDLSSSVRNAWAIRHGGSRASAKPSAIVDLLDLAYQEVAHFWKPYHGEASRRIEGKLRQSVRRWLSERALLARMEATLLYSN